MVPIGGAKLSKIIVALSISAGTVSLLYYYYRLRKNSLNLKKAEIRKNDQGLNRPIVQTKIIPKDNVPGLIGKGGSNIKKIQQDSNTRINFQDRADDNGDRICEIKGTSADVSIACDLIDKYLMSQPIVIETELKVPDSVIGRIIGRGGETIRNIQDQSKARVIVDPESRSNNRKEDDENFGDTITNPMKTIIIKGSEDQINVARVLIMEKVEEEISLKNRINLNASMRTTRRQDPPPPPPPSNPVNNSNSSPSASYSSSPPVKTILENKPDENPLVDLKTNIKSNIFEVFVSCVYNPNHFWIHIVGKDSVHLDKLTSKMTEYYTSDSAPEPDPESFEVNEVVAAPFPDDTKYYRAKILEIDDEDVRIFYLDYGDEKVVNIDSLRPIKSEYLTLKYQAIRATLNLESLSEDWSSETINEFCDLSYCAQWSALTAKIRGYLKEGSNDVVWIELIDKDSNIGNELIRLGYAKRPSEASSPVN